MQSYLWIALGSALGGMLRFGCTGLVAKLLGEQFPWGTLLINVAGSFLIGWYGTLTGPDGRYEASLLARQFVMVGICGGFTTFSSFSLQTLNLMNEGAWGAASLNVLGSVVLCLLGVWLGHLWAASLNGA